MEVETEYTRVVRVVAQSIDASAISQIQGLAASYYEETGLNFTMDHEVFRDNIILAATSPGQELFVLYEGNKVVGFSVLSYFRLFSVEMMCSMTGFYVHPDNRNHGSGLLFMSTILEYLEGNVSHVFANSISRLDEATALGYSALLRRCGFNEEEPTFIKEM